MVFVHEGGDSRFFGLLMPMGSCSIDEDRKGRKLFRDPCIDSWTSVEDLHRDLIAPESYRYIGLGNPVVSTLAEHLKHRSCSVELKNSVSGLRWKGLTCEDIEEEYDRGRWDGYCELLRGIGKKCEEALDQLSSRPAPWRIAGIEKSAKEYHEILSCFVSISETYEDFRDLPVESVAAAVGRLENEIETVQGGR